MKEVNAPVKTVHPEVINYIGLEYALELLKIAEDLRSGEIKPENFNMTKVYWRHDIYDIPIKTKRFKQDQLDRYGSCGTPCCIVGHLRMRVGDPTALYDKWEAEHARLGWRGYFSNPTGAIGHLFSGSNPSNPKLAAIAIEQYIYNNDSQAWNTAKRIYDSEMV